MDRLLLGAAAAACLLPATAQADSCVGTCGTAAPNGSITAPPGGSTYNYVATRGGVYGVGQIAGVGGVNGSEYRTDVFAGAAGDTLNFSFNYVTADGTGSFSDYAFAELLRNGSSLGYLFTARTTTSGDTSPGFGLPSNISTLTPGTTPIVAGAPVWEPLGQDSGTCYGAGCGYTGWIGSSYTLTDAGSYQLRFGVTNYGDSNVQSGLAFTGVTIAQPPVGGVPEPATWAMMIGGIGAAGGSLRRRQAKLGLAAA